MKIKDTGVIVEQVLREKPETRKNNNKLYMEVCLLINPMCANLDAGFFLDNIGELGLPQYESVTRARRKLQADNEELRADKETIDARYEVFKEVLEYVTE